ncbi:class I SAM-dependent methyltransferase [Phytoactinopolyspora endophytica]|uniref:class I SAM-dependent methyltransferase n=1 Tax=Phytoactinopolyspora endophytica TaxID=1642495 RepID=UPI00101D7DB4|nr:class I SAM-dependent methyltransferase [Phytoactinopolyspora endophytica]
MSDLNSQTAYWDAAATTKRFTHPLHTSWVDGVERSAAILDYGCGYGRTMAALEQLGFDNLSGVDTSPGMIARARSLHPAMRFDVLETPPTLTCADASIDQVVLFAVLTCIPGDEAQRLLIGELNRVLKPGAMLYLSDLLVQDDQRHRDRYARFADRYGTYGVFETDDGAVCRHHAREWFTALLADFEIIDTRDTSVTTMNGNETAGLQILARKPAPPRGTPPSDAVTGRNVHRY